MAVTVPSDLSGDRRGQPFRLGARSDLECLREAPLVETPLVTVPTASAYTAGSWNRYLPKSGPGIIAEITHWLRLPGACELDPITKAGLGEDV